MAARLLLAALSLAPGNVNAARVRFAKDIRISCASDVV